MSHQIDTFKDDVISLDEAAKHVSKITGLKRNKRVLQRWANRGVAGLRLPVVQIGGIPYTSQQALNAFLNEVAEAKRRRHSQATKAGISRAKQVERQAQELGI